MATLTISVALPMTPRQTMVRAAANRGEKKKFLDWFREALNKDALRETDPVLNQDLGGSTNGKSSSGDKKGAAPAPQKKGGFGLFGKK